MHTFDQALYDLYAAGEVSYSEAMDNADSRTDLALRVRLRGPAPEGGEVDEMQLEELAPDQPADNGQRLS
jgi:twitching motility protein PilU